MRNLVVRFQIIVMKRTFFYEFVTQNNLKMFVLLTFIHFLLYEFIEEFMLNFFFLKSIITILKERCISSFVFTIVSIYILKKYRVLQRCPSKLLDT